MSFYFDPLLSANTCITGMRDSIDILLTGSSSLVYTTPPPKSHVWENNENKVWCLTIDYRKPSQGDAGVLGIYRTHERAKQALAKYIENHYDRAITRQELSDGTVYGCDVTLEIVGQDLDGD